MTFNEWLLDVTNPATAFVPVEGESIIWGFTVMQERSPGPLVGVVSENGQQHVEEWTRQNPAWRDDYGPQIQSKILLFNSTNL
jgi:hypothetical protein